MLEKNYYTNGNKIYELNDDKLTYYFKNGKVKAEGILVNNKMEGEWKFYRETGEPWQIGNFKNGKKNGSWVRFDKNSQIEYQEFFIDDKKVKK